MTTSASAPPSDSYVVAAPSPPRQSHVPALDGVRGIAILLVLWMHFTVGEEAAGAIGRAYITVASIGWCGVDLFFVLSGFLITGILADAKGSDGYFRAFYARRTLRIFPLYYAVLAVTLIVLPRVAHLPPSVKPILDRQPWLWAYGANIIQALDGKWTLGSTAFGLGHFWSLSVEEHFYLIWPLCIWLMSRRAATRMCFAIALGAPLLRLGFVLAGASPLSYYTLTPCRMDALAIGGWLALLVRGGEVHADWLRRYAAHVTIVSLAAMVALFVLRRTVDAADPAVAVVGYSLMALAAAGLIALAVSVNPTCRFSRTLRHPILRAFGRYSYGLYVFHGVIWAGVAHLFVVSGWRQPGLIHIILRTLTAIAFSAALAVPSWHLFEQPINDLKRYFPYSRGRAT